LINRTILIPALAATALARSIATASARQYPIMENLARKVIAKYQTSSRADLAAKRAPPPPPADERLVRFLPSITAIRFIAAPR
jgi:hypothetical protein